MLDVGMFSCFRYAWSSHMRDLGESRVFDLHSSHRQGLHVAHGCLFKEHIDRILSGHRAALAVEGGDIRGIQLDRGTGGLRRGVGSRGSLVLLGGGSVDTSELEESHDGIL